MKRILATTAIAALAVGGPEAYQGQDGNTYYRMTASCQQPVGLCASVVV